MKCRHCAADLDRSVVDLGTAPPSNSYLSSSALRGPEKTYPLRVMVCERCWLVQTLDFTQAEELFSPDYAYFSSFSTSWLRHAESYVNEMADRFSLNASSTAVEVASNDGYLLQFAKARGLRCLGIEPTASTARAAREKGIDTIEVFFGEATGEDLAKRGWQADLMVANNVLAHVPDINDFLRGFARLLKPAGVATFEFPHLSQLLRHAQFDTIYHEHFSYLSLGSVDRVASRAGLQIFDVEELPTHGGSLRVFMQRGDTGIHSVRPSVHSLMAQEEREGLYSLRGYADFQTRAEKIKDDFVSFLIEAKRQGKRVSAYGAAAKGNTLMNFAGVRSDLLSYVIDRNPAKQGKFMPGSRIAILPEQHLRTDRPDYIVILPWNLRTEILPQLEYAREWGARFVTAIPSLEVV